MDLINLFPTSIAKIDLKKLEIEKTLQHVDSYRYVYSHGDGLYSENQNVLSDPFFQELKEEIELHCFEFAKCHGHDIQGVSICNSWVNEVNPGDRIHAHMHTNSYISGVFYLTEGSPIEFFDKGINDRIFSFLPLKIFDPNNSRSWSSVLLKAEPGKLILFPSELYHGVCQHNDSYIRKSIAFNSVPKGAFGDSGRRMNVVTLDDV